MNNQISLKIPYDKGFLKFSIATNRLLGVIHKEQKTPDGIKKLFKRSLDALPAKKRIEYLVRDKGRILVVVPDITRKSHLKEILPPLINRIDHKKRTINIIIATGLHKKHSAAQINSLLGNRVLKRCKILHHTLDVKGLLRLGVTRSGIPILLDKNIKRYDFIITLGLIEPHLYAGYSGGAKTIAIGLAGKPTIDATHNVKFLDDPLTKIGVIADNPFQNTLWQIIEKVPAGFSVNIINSPDGKCLKIFSGKLRDIFIKGVNYSKKVFEIQKKEPSDIVICGVGYPKDVNLYQSSRAINYILNVDRPVLKKGGVLIVVAGLKEGVGDSLSEKRFYDELKNMGSADDLVRKIKLRGCVAGEHRAYMVAKALLDYKVIFVSKNRKKMMELLRFPYFENIEDALDYADRMVGKESKLYVIPHALSTIAKLKF